MDKIFNAILQVFILLIIGILVNIVIGETVNEGYFIETTINVIPIKEDTGFQIQNHCILGSERFSSNNLSIYLRQMDYTSHKPIHIDGDEEFILEAENEGWPGSGTMDSPYIIEGYEIDASSVHGIWIENTRVYFIIRNCIIRGGGFYNDGVYLNSVQNGRIENTVSYNNDRGIHLFRSSNNILFGNEANDNYYVGFYIYSSSNNILNGNIANDNRWSGFYVDVSSYNVLTNNTADGNQYGFYVSSSRNSVLDNNRAAGDFGFYLISTSNSVLTNNVVSSTGDGIYFSDGIYLKDSWENILTNNRVCNSNEGIHLDSSSNNFLTNNMASYNTRGFYLYRSSSNVLTNNTIDNNLIGVYIRYQSSENTIANNKVSKNRQHGVYLILSSNNTLTLNYIQNNVDNGIYLDSYSNNNEIYYNNIIGNHWNAYIVQSFRNKWYGNYWDDWIGIGPKIIHGRIKIFNITVPWFNFDWHPARDPWRGDLVV
ncbi:MAG: hypothetical protein DRN12_05990 [Thermoplasmata archaeon]|nr:MAG: hypothetical protein DRN12_05990 [Thermoplasmata archaeon]